MSVPAEAIQVRSLVKEYGTLAAVAGIDLDVAAGEVFALLGPNGAGKSTTVEILEGHRTATSGDVRVLGLDPQTGGRELRERIGIVLQEHSVERELSVREAIEYYGSLYPRRRHAAELVEIVGLEGKAGDRIKTLSGGQRRRLDLALGLAGDPELVFLDEPTTGFDPAARRQAWTVVENLRSLGKTILLTTHYLDEAQHLADRVAVIAAGRIVAEGTPDTLGDRANLPSLITFQVPPGGELPPGLDATLDAGRATLASADPTRDLHTLTSWALERGIALDGLDVHRPTLEDVYLDLVGDGLGENGAKP